MNNCKPNSIAGLIFSKDRAMQLQAAIDSFYLHCRGRSQIQLHVLYKASSRLHSSQYDRLKQTFGDVSFIAEADFKAQVLEVVGGFEYVLFGVDDNLFTGDFCPGDIVASLQHNADAVGFSLRLGSNTTCCYARDAAQKTPHFQQVEGRILKYDWTQGEYDFGYPLELSSSVYRTADIRELLAGAEFTNPNTLEGAMAANSHQFRWARNSLLCFERSVAFCAPVNMVQTVWDNRVGANPDYSVDRLGQMFDDGIEIDVERYSGFVPNSCHQEVELHFKDCSGPAAQRPTLSDGACPTDDRQHDSGPKFSIVMANYNNARYIAQAIESVRRQTFEDWELIIVEDCSTDNSQAAISEFLGDARIRLIRHQINQGYTAALKTGIANVRSEYFGILDSDDCLTPQAVETMHKRHVEFADCGLIYSQFVFCGEDLTQRRIGFCNEIPPGRTTLDACAVSHFKTFKLRDYLRTAGYDEHILHAEDVDIVYKMEEVTGLKFVDEPLYFYRESPDSACRSPGKINIGIMSRVKARINALNRRCRASAEQQGGSFDELFRREVAEAGRKHEDVEQYFIILAQLYENRMLANVDWPPGAEHWPTQDAILWLAANVDIQFDKLFDFIASRKTALTDRPLVTVEMAAYNAEKFISQAIDSVLAQTYRNFELLIVDDGSTDGTADIIASYSDSRIRYIRTAHKNCASARNRVIAEAAGEYLLCVDSDDFIDPTYIERMVAPALQRPEVDYFYPRRLEPVDRAGNPTPEQWSYQDFFDNMILPAFLFDKGYGPVPNPGSLKRKSMFDRVGGYADVNSVEDFVFLCSNALKIRFMPVEDHSTYFYRRLATGNSHNFEARNRIMADALNAMVSIYPAEVLCPQISAMTDPAQKERQYCEYLMRTFYKHAAGPMVEYAEYFRRYGDSYKQKLLQMAEPNRAAGPV